MLSLLPDLREMAQRGEDFLYFKHMQGHAPHHTLLMEMLLAKRNDVVSSLNYKFIPITLLLLSSNRVYPNKRPGRKSQSIIMNSMKKIDTI